MYGLLIKTIKNFSKWLKEHINHFKFICLNEFKQSNEYNVLSIIINEAMNIVILQE